MGVYVHKLILRVFSRSFLLRATNGVISRTSPTRTNFTFGVMSIFGSTYLCKQFFSSMNYIKSKHGLCLTDDSLQSCVKIKVMSYSPDMEKLCSEVQKHKPHQSGERNLKLIKNLMSYYFANLFLHWTLNCVSYSGPCET